MTNQVTGETRHIEHTLAFLLLRGWLGVRAILTGVEKYSTTHIIQKPLIDPTTGMEDPSGAMIDVAQKVYSLTNYAAIPQSMQDKFASEPLLLKWMTVPFYFCLGPALILLGITLLVGIATRASLFLQGLLYIVLTVGLILIKQDDGVAWLAIHVAMIAMALTMVRYNRFCLWNRW